MGQTFLILDAKIGESALKMAVNNISFGGVRGYSVETTVKKQTVPDVDLESNRTIPASTTETIAPSISIKLSAKAVQFAADRAEALQSLASSPISSSLPGVLTSDRMIAFVDGALEDATTLMQDLQGQGIRAVLLDPESDEVTQMANQLKSESGLVSVHIFSHGGSGFLKLGTEIISQNDLTRYTDQFGTISAALSDEGDIHLYGCDVASGEAGGSFISALAESTKADIAASINKTGTIALGGDWTLEQHIGPIESGDVAIENYGHTLSKPTTDASVWTTANIASLTTAEVAALSTDDLTSLSTLAISSFSTAQIKAITSDQISTLTTDQISSLTTSQIASLSTSQIAGLSTDQVVALTTAQVNALTTTQIAALTTDQIAALTTTE